MKLRKNFKFQSNMILFFTLTALIPIIILSTIYLSMFQKLTYENLIKEKLNKLDYMIFNVNNRIIDAENFINGYMYNKDLIQLLIKNYSTTKEMYIEIVKFNNKTQNILLTNLTENIIKIVFIGNNNVVSQIGTATTTIDIDYIYKNNFADQYNGSLEPQLIIAPDKYINKEYSFPISRTIKSITDDRKIGDILIFFDENLLSNILKKSNMANDEHIFIINHLGQCIANTNSKHVGSNLTNTPYVNTILASKTETGYFETKINNKLNLIIYKKDTKRALVIVETYDLHSYIVERNKLIQIFVIIFALSTIVCLISIVVFSNRLSKPIRNILTHINKIADGNMELNYSIQEHDEIGIIGKGINKMVISIRELMIKTVEKEREKKEMEFKMLQCQINPHFLYNTLNSIKWLATMQNTTKIKNITTALSSLLKSLSKDTAQMISICDELIFIQDYIYIQNIRYDDKIKLSYNFETKDLSSAMILKFTLQPIIENAIFHGIVPKEGFGEINISISKNNNKIIIKVRDNGVGMSREVLENIFNTKGIEKSINSIGLKNVDERLKLYYGEGFGLSISSEENVFTEIIIHFPYSHL